MKKFNRLIEEYLDLIKHRFGQIEIFKNPTMRELNDCGRHCRGILDKSGNLFVINILDNDKTPLHKDLFEIFKHKRLLKGDPENYYKFKGDGPELLGTNVIRKDMTKEFFLGESVIVKDDWSPVKRDNTQSLKSICKKAEKNVKGMKFIPITINEIYLKTLNKI